MVIDRASIFADRFKDQPQILQAAVLGPSPVPGLDPYTALRAVQLLKESAAMNAARAAQQPTNSPSLVQTAMQMPQMPSQMARPAPQQAAPQQAPMMAASGGLAALPSGSHDYALGGIVSFNGEGKEGQLASSVAPSDSGGGGGDETAAVDPYEALQKLIEGYQQTGDPILHQKAVQLQFSLIKDLASRQAVKPKESTPEQEAADIRKYVETRQREAGPSPFASLRQEIATARGERDKNLQQAQGVALLRAAGRAAQPGGTVRGLAAAAEEFGGAYGQALQADRAERRALANMEMNIADAERKERMGLYSEARASRTAAAKEAKDAETAQFNRDANLIRLTGGVAKTLEPRRGAGTAKPPSLPQVDRRIAELQEQLIDIRRKDPNDPRIPVLQEKIKELRDTLIASKDLGPERVAGATAERAIKIGNALNAAFKTFSTFDPAYQRADNAGKLAIEEKFRADRRKFYETNPEAIESDLAGRYSPSRAAPPAAAAPAAAPAEIDFSALPTSRAR